MSVKHIYVHIPFCKKKCPYCDFFSLPIYSNYTKTKYTTSLIKELKARKVLSSKPLKTIYFGGGSPLMLGTDNLNQIISKLRSSIDKRTEISIELNPEHLEGKQQKIMALLSGMHFNRLSIGVQTTNERILSMIERSYDINELLKTISALRKRDSILSLDFMFGLPGQTIKDLMDDIDFIKQILPQHISFYLFTPPERYQLIDQCASYKLASKMMGIISSSLKTIGYKHYEVSNFCLDKNLCKHNMAYWARQSYLGLGAGAHSFDSTKNIRSWNVQDIKAYMNDPVSSFGYEKLTKRDKINENIFLGLRLLDKGIKESLLENKDYRTFINSNMLRLYNGHLMVTEKGLPLLNYISSSLMTY